jgi:hypothetical protein
MWSQFRIVSIPWAAAVAELEEVSSILTILLARAHSDQLAGFGDIAEAGMTVAQIKNPSI